MLRFV